MLVLLMLGGLVGAAAIVHTIDEPGLRKKGLPRLWCGIASLDASQDGISRNDLGRVGKIVLMAGGAEAEPTTERFRQFRDGQPESVML